MNEPICPSIHGRWVEITARVEAGTATPEDARVLLAALNEALDDGEAGRALLVSDIALLKDLRDADDTLRARLRAAIADVRRVTEAHTRLRAGVLALAGDDQDGMAYALRALLAAPGGAP